MRRGLTFTFVIGLLLGGMAALIVWYWQKSTSAEDGALVLLDKLAAADRRIRQLKGEKERTELESPPLRIRIDGQTTDEVPSFLERPSAPAEAEDLTRVKGIGPVFAARLQEANIQTLQALTAVPPAKLAKILQISESRSVNILEAANSLS
jgi:predicted flap endonuclease-1-like 5' DNA nuclease